jgi:hypothetical protein
MIRKVVLVALATATLVCAQGRGGGRGGGGGGGGDMGSFAPMPRAQRLSKLDQFSEKLKLNKEQVEEVNKILGETNQKVAPMRAEIEKSRTNIAGAHIQGVSPDELKKLMEAHTALEVQVDGLEVETFAKIYALLKPNQQSKAAQAFEFLAGAFDGAPGGGGGGRGGRRGQ